MKQSKSMQLWNILYPIFLYFAATTFVLYVLELLLPPSIDSRLLRQLITSIAVLPLLYRDYRQDQKKLLAPKKSVKKQLILVSFFIGGCFAVAWNNLLGMVHIADYSASYGQVQQTFYTGSLLLEITALCIVIPLVEELLYRGIVYGRAREWLGIKWGIVVSALIFGFIHMNLVQFVYASVFGLLLAGLTERTNGVQAAIAAHMAANLTSVLRAETSVFAFLNKSLPAQIAATVLLLGITAVGIYYSKAEDN